jgi:CO/xanthine dehydrogenase FAD-binding subunit
MKYYRPESIEETIALLEEGVPLGGGTALAPKRHEVQAVIDLSHLGLDAVQVDDGLVQIGAAAKLQSLIDPPVALPDGLKRACRLEAGWNLRNMATIGGTIMSADARSPLLLVLLALGTHVHVHGEDSSSALDALLERRADTKRPFLITHVSFQEPGKLGWEYVARTPNDRPIVSAAASTSPQGAIQFVAIGGFGERPILLKNVEGDRQENWTELAAEWYSQAGDAFASADYRSEVAAILVGRVVKEVQI